jgi:hypothetical protein
MSSKLPRVEVLIDVLDYTALKELAKVSETSMSKLVALMIRRTLTGQWTPAATLERKTIADYVLPRATAAEPNIEDDPLML